MSHGIVKGANTVLGSHELLGSSESSTVVQPERTEYSGRLPSITDMYPWLPVCPEVLEKSIK